MQTITRKKLILFNIAFSILILLDCVLPGRITPILEFDSFYNFRAKISGGARPSYVDRKILLLTNGETFRICKIPDGDYAKGQKNQIVKSAFSGNIKEIVFLNNKVGRKSVSIFLNNFLLYSLILSFAVSCSNGFYDNRILSVLLVASTLFMFIFTIGYFLT